MVVVVCFSLEGLLCLRERYRTAIGGVYPEIFYQHEQLRHTLIPNATHYGRVAVNSLGFRGPEITLEKPPNTIRIVCMGGSTTFDTYVSSNDKTWTQRLEALLKQKFDLANIQVINAGVPGYRVLDNLINLQTRLLVLNPDIIIDYDGHNDVQANRNIYLSKNLRLGEVKTLDPIIKFLQEKSLLYQKATLALRYFEAARESEKSRRYDVVSETGLANFERVLSLLVYSSQRNGITVILPRVVTGFRKEMPSAEQVENAKWAFHFMRHLTLKGIFDGYDRYNQVIKKVAHEYGALYIDETAKISDGHEYFADGIHFTDKGAELVAKIIGDEILKRGLLHDVLSRRQQRTMHSN